MAKSADDINLKFFVTGDENALSVGTVFSIPREDRPFLQAMAEAHGFSNLVEWLDDQMNDKGAHHDLKYLAFQLEEWRGLDPVQKGLEIWHAATEGDDFLFPWKGWGEDFEDPFNMNMTEEEYREKVRQWAVARPESAEAGEITEGDAKLMKEMAEAALALNGKRARELYEQLLEEWS